MFAKTEVNGANASPAFQYLRMNSSLYDPKKKQAKEIPWNFAKFLVNEEGKVVSYHEPRTLPDDLENQIKSMLKWN